MRHGKSHRVLGRTKRQRVALMRSLARSLVLNEGIVTTVTKAKELRPFIEELVTASKKNTLQSRRLVASRIGDRGAVTKLHTELAKRYESRNGGYTRIVKLGRISARETESARIEFVK